MQRSCSSCLARQAISSTTATRSYSIVPKPKPKSNPTSKSTASKPETEKARPFGVSQVDGPSTRAESDKRRGFENYKMRSGERGSSSRRSGTIIRRKDMIRQSDQSTFPTGSTRDADRPRPDPRSISSVKRPSTAFIDTPSGSSSRKYHFKALHHETAIPAFHRPSTPTTPIIKYRDDYLFLRAAPTHTLPTPPPLPFPSNSETYQTKYPNREVINFGVVASKAAVSPFAPERGKVRKRFKAAVEEIINIRGLGDVRSDWSYLAVLNRQLFEADMKDLCESLENGLKFIKRQQERGIGSVVGKGDRRDRRLYERGR